MLRRLLLPLAILAVSLTAVAVGNAGTQKSPGLTGEVGPGFSIEVKLAGKDLKTIKAGTYAIKVQDKSNIHNFHLKGPGVNKSTSVPFTGSQTWKVTLKPGKYTYQCDPHAAGGMKGTFKVTR
ncbi:MAG: cupredoxin domain-containing protein [Gaiellaceae bacterium]